MMNNGKQAGMMRNEDYLAAKKNKLAIILSILLVILMISSISSVPFYFIFIWQSSRLMKAVRKRDYQKVETCLSRGDDPNNYFGVKPLHIAASNGDDRIVEILLKHGARVNATGSKSDTPLGHAVSNEHYSTADILIKSGAKISNPEYVLASPLHEGVRKITSSESNIAVEEIVSLLLSEYSKNGGKLDEGFLQTPIKKCMESKSLLARDNIKLALTIWSEKCRENTRKSHK